MLRVDCAKNKIMAWVKRKNDQYLYWGFVRLVILIVWEDHMKREGRSEVLGERRDMSLVGKKIKWFRKIEEDDGEL